MGEAVIGYHQGDYAFPKNDQQRFEICIGAMLTQNTNWNNVVKALMSLQEADLLSIEKLQSAKIDQIAVAIRSAGYYNQKAQYLKNLVYFLSDFTFAEQESFSLENLRGKLLKVKGIGPETADCILLYAFNRCSFVVDAYTMRILGCLGVIPSDPYPSYATVKQLFESSVRKDPILYQEFHALLVYHGKKHYSKKPYGKEDRLLIISTAEKEGLF